jgi:NAD(P)-dependent dehydrogenase (short-subunit alcohol dehydrogenase family)
MQDPHRLCALVTGASRGIGRAIASELARRGVRVAVHFRREQAAAQAVRDALEGDGHVICGADFSEPAGALNLWQAATAGLGRIDILVNNAGLFVDHPPLNVTFEAWAAAWGATLAANLLGPAHLSWLAGRAMNDLPAREPFGRGRIVNISSRGAFRGEPDSPAYGASKAGLNSLSQSLAKALAPRAIYVYCLAPGWVETDMARAHLHGPQGAEILAQHPLGRVASTGELADAAAYCALSAPPAMTGGVIDVNGASYLRT